MVSILDTAWSSLLHLPLCRGLYYISQSNSMPSTVLLPGTNQHLSWALGNLLPFGKDSPLPDSICEVTIPSVFQGLALCSNSLRSQNPYQLFVFWQSRILDSLDQCPCTTALRPQGSTKNWNTKIPKAPEMLWPLSNAQVQKHVFASLPRNWESIKYKDSQKHIDRYQWPWLNASPSLCCDPSSWE